MISVGRSGHRNSKIASAAGFVHSVGAMRLLIRLRELCGRIGALARIVKFYAETGYAVATESAKALGTILLGFLVPALAGVIPTWPHSSTWGYGPNGVGAALRIVVILRR